MNVIHSLGMGGWLAAIAGGTTAAAAVAGARRRARRARRRREALLGVSGPRRRLTLPIGRLRELARAWGLPVGAGIAAAWCVGGALGCLAGLAVAVGTRRWRRRAAEGPSPVTVAAENQLPEAAELLAACLASGAAPVAAADAVGRTLGGPLGRALRRIAAEVRLGGDPARCWERLSAVPGAGDLARWMARAASTGVPPVAAVSRLAAECRAARARSAGARARRAAVLATAPLGLCFLPAFLAVGVVPVVIGLAEVMTTTR